MAKKKKGDAAEGADGAAAGPKPPSKPKSMLTGAMFVLLGAMGYKFVLAGTPAQTVLVSAPIDAVAGAHGATSEADCSDVAAEAETSDAPHGKSGGGAAGGTVTLSDMTIRLADADAAHYVKVGIALELGEGVVAEEFETEKAKASDVAVRYFSEKTSTQLSGTTAIETAKLELTCLMQVAYAEPVEEGAKKPATPEEPKVAHVLFTQFLMQ
jgi:flagellar basal body-associated protein FliL